MKYIKKEFKKLGSIFLVGGGSFLILEHIYTYGRINIFDILGHEWLGIVLIIAGILFANDWKQSWGDAWAENKAKLKYVLRK